MALDSTHRFGVGLLAIVALSWACSSTARADTFVAVTGTAGTPASWSANATWSQNGGLPPAARVPGDGFTNDVVIIEGFTVNQDRNGTEIATLTITTSTAVTPSVLTLTVPLTTNGGITVTATAGTATLNMNGQNLTVQGGTIAIEALSGGTAQLINNNLAGTLLLSGSGTLGSNAASSTSVVTLFNFILGATPFPIQSTTLGSNLPTLTVNGSLTVETSATLDLNGKNLTVGDTGVATAADFDELVVNGTIVTSASGTTTINRSLDEDAATGKDGISGAGTMTANILTWAAGTGGGQSTPISATIIVLNNFFLENQHNADLTGTLVVRGDSDSTTPVVRNNNVGGDGDLFCDPNSMIVFEQDQNVVAGPFLVPTAVLENAASQYGNLRFRGVQGTEVFQYTTTRIVAGNVEVVSGTLDFTDTAAMNDNRTISGDLSIGVTISGPLITGTGIVDAADMTNDVLTVGGDMVFGVGGTLDPPQTVTLSGSGNLVVPDNTGAVFNTLLVGQVAGVTTITGPGTLLIRTALTVGSGLLTGGTNPADTATIDIDNLLTVPATFSSALADFQPQSLTVRYSSGTTASVINVTYGDLVVADNTTATTAGNLNVTGELRIVTGTMIVPIPATTIEVDEGTFIETAGRLSVTTAVTGTFGGGVTINGAGVATQSIIATVGAFGMNIVSGNFTKSGAGSVTTNDGPIAVSAGAFTISGGTVNLGTGDLTVVGASDPAVSISAGSLTVDVLSVTGNLSNSGSATLTIGGANSTVSGDLTSLTPSTLNLNIPDGTPLRIGGSLNLSGVFTGTGTFSTKILEFNGTGASTITTSVNLPTVTRSQAAGSLTFSLPGATITGSLNATAGTISIGGQAVTVDNAGNDGDDVNVSSGATLNIAGGTLTVGDDVSIAGGGTLQDIGGSAGTLILSGSTSSSLGGGGSINLDNLTLNGTTVGTSTVTVNGVLTNNGAFTAPSVLNINGTYTDLGTLTAGAGTVNFGAGASFARGSTTPAVLANFTTQGSGTVMVTQGLEFTGNGTVGGSQLVVSGGDLVINNGANLVCNQPARYNGGGSLLLETVGAGTISGSSTFTLQNSAYTGNTGVISVATFEYDGTGTVSRRAYGGNLQFVGGGGTSFTFGGGGAWTVGTTPTGGNLIIGNGNVSVDATGTPVTLRGNLAHTAGTFVAPSVVTFDTGGQTRTLQTAATLHDLTIGTNSTVQLAANLTVDNDLVVQTAAVYQALGFSLSFVGNGSWKDDTSLQNFGNVTISGGPVNVDTPVTMESLTITSSGLFSPQSNVVTIRGNLNINSSAAVDPGTSTFSFAGPGVNTAITGGKSLSNVTAAKTGGGGQIDFADPMILAGDLTVSSGIARLLSSTTVTGTVLVDNGTDLAIPTSGTARAFTFVGQFRVDPTGEFNVTQSDAALQTITFTAGLVVEQSGEFRLNATSGGPVSLGFGANSVSRVGPLTPGSETTTAFVIDGGGAKNVTIDRAGGTGTDQWSISYNRLSSPIPDPNARIQGCKVANSDANAGNQVRANVSDNNGNNENWNFGGASVIAGSLGTLANARIRLVIDRSPVDLSLTTDTIAGGAFAFEVDFQPNDKFVMFADDVPNVRAVAAGIIPTGAAGLIGINLTDDRFVIVGQSLTSTALTVTSADLNAVDFGVVNDTDVVFDVDNNGILTVSNGVQLDVADPFNAAGGFVATGGVLVTDTLTVGAASSITGALTVTNSALAAFNAGNPNVSGNVLVTAGGTLTTGPSSVLTAGGDIGVPATGTFNMGANASAGGALNLGGAFNPATGAQIAVAGAVTIDAAASIAAVPWSLNINGTGTQALSIAQNLAGLTVSKATGVATLGGSTPATLTVASLTVSSPGTGAFNLGGTDLTSTANVIVSGGDLQLAGENLDANADLIISGGVVTASGTETIRVLGNWARILPGNFIPANSTVIFQGSAALPSQITGLVATNFFNLRVETGREARLLSDVNVAGTLTVEAGADFDLRSAVMGLSASPGPAIVIGAGGNFRESTSTVRYTATVGTVTINTSADVDYFNLELAGTAIYQPSDLSVTVLRDLTVSGGTLNLLAGTTVGVSNRVQVTTGQIAAASGTTMFVDNNWTMAGPTSYVGAGSANVVFSGTTNTQITAGGSAFRTLTIAKLGTAAALAQDALLVSGPLNVDSGLLNLVGNNMTASDAIDVDALGRITQIAPGLVTVSHTADRAVTVDGPVTVNNLTLSGSAATLYGGVSTLTVNVLTIGVSSGADLSHGSGSIVLSRANAAVVQPLIIDTANGASYIAAVGGSARLTIQSTVADGGGGPVQVPIDGATYNDLDLQSTVAGTQMRLTGAGTNLTIQRSLTLALVGTFDANAKTTRFTTNSSGTFTPDGETFSNVAVDKAGGTLTLGGDATLNSSFIVTAGTVELNGNDLTVSGGPITIDGVLEDDAPTRGTVRLQAGPAIFNVGASGSATIGTLALDTSTTLNGPGVLTIRDLLIGNAAVTISFGATAAIDLGGGPTPFNLNGGSATANSASLIRYTGASATVTAIAYGRLAVNGPGPYTLQNDTTVAASLTVTSGELRTAANDLTAQASVTVAPAGTLDVGSGGSLLMNNGQSASIAGTFRLAGGTLGPDTAGEVFAFALTGSGSFVGTGAFAVSGIPAGIVVPPSAAIALTGTSPGAPGTINVANNGTGLSFTGARAADVNFSEVKFQAPGGFGGATRNVSTPTSPFTIRFTSTFGGTRAAAVGQIGNLWGDDFDSDADDTSPTSAISQGVVEWSDGTPPTIVSIATFDDKDSTGASFADGNVDRLRITLNEPVNDATLVAAGFGIDVVGGSSVATGAAPDDEVIDVVFANAAQVAGSGPKLVDYSLTGGLKDHSGVALSAVVDFAGTDSAGPVIQGAVLDTLGDAVIANDVVTLTFSEPLNVLPATPIVNANDFTTNSGVSGFVVRGGAVGGGNTVTITQDGAGAAAPTDRPATISLTAATTAVRDAAANAPSATNRAATLKSPPAPAGLFDFVVSRIGAGGARAAGEAFQLVISARNLEDLAIGNFAPTSGLTIELLDFTGAANGELATRPLDFRNFAFASAQGGAFSFNTTTGVLTITGLSFDPNGEYSVTVENTKASLNAVDTNARQVRARVTDIRSGLSGNAANGRGTLPAASALSWSHATATQLLTLFGDGNTGTSEQGEELLVQGVRDRDLAVGVSATGRVERTAGVTYTARVIEADPFFNIARNNTGRNITIRPGTVSDDPRRASNLNGTDGLPLDTPQSGTITAGVVVLPVKNFLAALNHRLVAADSPPVLAGVPSSAYDVFPGAPVAVQVLLPQQTLTQGVAANVTPVAGTAFGNELVAQGNDFIVRVLATDAHGNWNFNLPNNAMVVRTNDSVSTTADLPGNFDQDTTAQRLGVAISGIGAGTVIPDLSADLRLTFNNQGAASVFDLDERASATEIRDALQSQFAALPFLSGSNAEVQVFAPFNRYVLRSGEAPSASVQSRVVPQPDGDAIPDDSEVDLLRLGADWDPVGTLGSTTYPGQPGRASSQFSAPFYQPSPSSAADLANPGFEPTLRLQAGLAFASARSQQNTQPGDNVRRVRVRLRDPIAAQTEFQSTPFAVSLGALIVRSAEALDDDKNGAIDRIRLTFEDSDTINPTQDPPLVASSFRLSAPVGSQTLLRQGTTVSINSSANTLDVTFVPGLPTTSVSGLRLVGPTLDGIVATLNLAGGITDFVDRAPPVVISTHVQDGLLEITFSEPIEFAAPRATLVSGVHDSPTTIAVPANSAFTFTDGPPTRNLTVSFGSGGAAGATNIVNVIGGVIGAGNVSFENGRFILRSVSPAAPGADSFASVSNDVNGALDALKLTPATGLRSVPGVFSPTIGDIDDIVVLSRTGVDLRAGPPVVVGDRVLIPLANQNGDLSPPFFALLDDFNRNLVTDLSAEGNSAGGLVSNVPGLQTQNLADKSGFIRAREQDAFPGDGIFQNVAPGFFQTDIAGSALPASAIAAIELIDVEADTGGQIPPSVVFPQVSSFPHNFGTTNLARTQVGVIVLSPGRYFLEYRVTLTGDFPLGLAVDSANRVTQRFQIEVDNFPPVAAANDGPLVVPSGTTITLDGSGSVDPNFSALTFLWAQASGPAANIVTETLPVTDVTLPLATSGVFEFTLQVSDGNPLTASTARITVVVQDPSSHVPMADAGLSQVVRAVQTGVRLNGSLSFDPDNDSLTFSWTQVAGPAVGLGLDPQRPSDRLFTAPPNAAFLRFRLVVSDGTNTSPADTVDVTVEDDNSTPADRTTFMTFEPTVGSDTDPSVPYRFARTGERLTLDAGASQGVPRVADYQWRQIGGPTVTIDDGGDTATFVPALSGDYTIELVGRNPEGTVSRPFVLTIRAVDAADLPPAATIAPLAATTVEVGTGVSLAATSSVGGSTFRWRQLEGPLTPVSDADAATVTITPAEAGVYVYEVTAFDPPTRASDRATISFGANNTAAADRIPVAQFAAPADALVGQTVGLNGSATDPDGAAVSLFFVQTTGLPSVLNGNGASNQSFVAAASGEFGFEAVAYDGRRTSLPVPRGFNIGAGSSPSPVATGAPPGRRSSGGCTAAAGAGPVESAGAILPLLVLVLAAIGRAAWSRLGRAGLGAVLGGLVLLGSGCAALPIGLGIALAIPDDGGGPPTPTQPDLILSAVEGPSVAMLVDGTSPGGAPEQRVVFLDDGGNLSANVINTFLGENNSGFKVEWFLSKSKSIDGSAFSVRSVDVTNPLTVGGARRITSPGGSETGAVPVVAGAQLSPGRYFLIGRVNGSRAIAEIDFDNNDTRSETVVELYDASAPLPAPGPADIVVTRASVPTAVLTGTTLTGSINLTNVGGPVSATLSASYTVLLTSGDSLVGGVPIGSGSFAIPAAASLETPHRETIFFRHTSTGRFNVAVQVTVADANADNNFRFAATEIVFYNQNTVFSNGANLPATRPGDPTVLDVATQRPAISTSLDAGGQRLLAFEIPDTGIEPLVSQALITVQSTDFDPIAELLSPAGDSVLVVDDFSGSNRALIYATLSATRGNRSFFLVVSATNASASGNFTVTIDVNATAPGDDEPVGEHDVGDILSLAPPGMPIDLFTTIPVGFDFRSLENEFMFEVAAPGRYALSLRKTLPFDPLDPLFIDPAVTTLLRFDDSGEPRQFEIVLEQGPNNTLLLNSLEGDGLFTLQRGVYILVVRAQFLPLFLDEPFELVFGPGLLFDRTIQTTQ